MSNQEKYHWSQLQSNTYAYKINLEQYFLENGQEMSLKTLLKGEARGNGGCTRTIIFDREYVIAFLLNRVFVPLTATQIKAVFTILFKAFFEYCKQTDSKVDLKVYKLHGEPVIKLSDIGINYDELKEISNG